MQMEEAARRIRRLARNLCPGELLGQKESPSSSVSAFAATGNHPNQSKYGKPRFYLYQSASGRHGHSKKAVFSLSEEPRADGTPNFIWPPHLIEMG